MGGKTVLVISVLAFVLALASSVRAVNANTSSNAGYCLNGEPNASNCLNDDYLTRNSDIVITGTVTSVGYGYAVVSVVSFEKKGSYVVSSEITVQNTNNQPMASGNYFYFSDKSVGKTYRMFLKKTEFKNVPYAFEFFSIAGLREAAKPLPCWDNVCPGTGMFFGCCDSNANGKYEQTECASDAAWKYQTKELTLEQACAEQVKTKAIAVRPRAEFTLNLKPGWNLVSVPVANFQQIMCVKAPCYQPMPANLKSNTCPAVGTKVFAFDRANNKYVDQTNSLYTEIYPQGGFEAGRSYWVKTASDCEMAFDGTHRMFGSVDPLIISSLPPAADISSGSGWALSSGWNNIGAPIDNTEFKKVSAACTLKTLWRYNAAARKWEKAEVLKPGEGYFVKAASDCGLGINQQPTPTPVPSGRETLKISTVQCMGNPWEQDWLKTHDAAQYPPKQSDDAKRIIKAFYEKQGFTVYSVEFKGAGDGVAVCLACSCSEGYSVVLTVSKANAQAYCVQDSDCVRQSSCCDCGLGTYVNNDYFRISQCTGPQCKCAVQLSKGICQDNQCKAVPLSATPIPTPVVNTLPARQLTFAKDAVFNLFDFVNVNGKRQAIYWKRAYDGTNFGEGSIESLDVDSGQVTTIILYNGMAESNGKYLTYTEGNCVRYRDIATNVEGTAECGGEGADYNDLNQFVPVAAGDSIYYLDRTSINEKYIHNAMVDQKTFNESVFFPVYAYDVKTGIKREAFRVNQDFNAVSDGKTIAWTDYSFAHEIGSWVGPEYFRPGATGTPSNYVARGENGPLQVYHFDPATNTISVSPMGQKPNYLAVNGKYVAYSAGVRIGKHENEIMYSEIMNQDVYLFDVESKKTSILAASEKGQINLDSDGNWLVWHAGGSANDDQVWAYAYSTGEKRQVTSGEGSHSVPHVLGNSVVFTGGGTRDGIFIGNNLFLVDIK